MKWLLVVALLVPGLAVAQEVRQPDPPAEVSALAFELSDAGKRALEATRAVFQARLDAKAAKLAADKQQADALAQAKSATDKEIADLKAQIAALTPKPADPAVK